MSDPWSSWALLVAALTLFTALVWLVVLGIDWLLTWALPDDLDTPMRERSDALDALARITPPTDCRED